jgi:peptide deformylase
VREEIFRPELLHIRYRDANFEPQELETEGFIARVIQHEFDHLQGIFFTDHLKGLRKRLVMPVLKKIKRGEGDADYSMSRDAEVVA